MDPNISGPYKNSCERSIQGDVVTYFDGRSYYLKTNEFSEEQLEKKYLEKQKINCNIAINDLLPSLPDLKRIVSHYRKSNRLNTWEWAGSLLRTVAIREQLKEHCKTYGGPFSRKPKGCGRYANTIKEFYKENKCPVKKEINLNYKVLNEVVPKVKESLRKLH